MKLKLMMKLNYRQYVLDVAKPYNKNVLSLFCWASCMQQNSIYIEADLSINEPWHDKIGKWHVRQQRLDQPGHIPSLIRVTLEVAKIWGHTPSNPTFSSFCTLSLFLEMLNTTYRYHIRTRTENMHFFYISIVDLVSCYWADNNFCT